MRTRYSVLAFAVAIALPFVVPSLYRMHLKWIAIPRIKLSGAEAHTQRNYAPLVPDRAPSQYAIVTVKHLGAIAIETFYQSSGWVTEVKSQNGEWIAIDHDNQVASAAQYPLFFGSALVFTLVGRRVALRLRGERETRPVLPPWERTSLLCGILVVVSSIVCVATGIW
jgi:hypothetical protein